MRALDRLARRREQRTLNIHHLSGTICTSQRAAAKRAAVAEGEKLLALAEGYRAANQLDRAFVAALLVLRRIRG